MESGPRSVFGFRPIIAVEDVCRYFTPALDRIDQLYCRNKRVLESRSKPVGKVLLVWVFLAKDQVWSLGQWSFDLII